MKLPNVPNNDMVFAIMSSISMYTGVRVTPDQSFTRDELLLAASKVSDVKVRNGFFNLIQLYSQTVEKPGKVSAVPLVPKTEPSNVPPLVITRGQSAPKRNKNSLNHWAQRIRAESLAIGLDPEFAEIVAWKESNMVPTAISSTGASGLFQLTRIAVDDVKQRYPVTGNDRLNPEWNIFVGVRYLSICAGYAGVPAGARSNLTSEQRVATYACFNIGVGNYRKIKRKEFSDVALVDAINLQARVLRQDGPVGYLSNVREWLNV